MLLAVAVAVGSLHVGHLLYLQRALHCRSLSHACPDLIGALETPDTASYRRAAEQIEAEGFFSASYLKRTPGLPLAFLIAKRLGGREVMVLWVVPLLAAGAALAIGWIGWRTTGRLGVGLGAVLLFAAWPSAYQLAPVLMTDGMHGFLAVSALAATLWWRGSKRPRAALLAAGLWMATQSLRHTFFALPALLPLLLLRRGAEPRVAVVSLALWLATWVVPGFVLVSNQLQHGRLLAVQGCYAVPRLQEQLGLGEFPDLRRQCKEEMRADPEGLVARERQFLRDHPWQAVRSYAGEISRQTFAALLPFVSRALMGLYPTWTWWFAPVKVFWACSLCGLILLLHRDPRLAFFLLLSFALVMIPASNVHLVGSRIRFPLDLLFIPVAVAGVWWAAAASWAAVRSMRPATRALRRRRSGAR